MEEERGEGEGNSQYDSEEVVDPGTERETKSRHQLTGVCVGERTLRAKEKNDAKGYLKVCKKKGTGESRDPDTLKTLIRS